MKILEILRSCMKENNSKGPHIGFVGLLTLIFITLKLTDYIDWSWWWVLSPLWISFSMVIVIIVVLGVFKILDKR